MARETRGSAAAAVPDPAVDTDAPAAPKRKRQPSTSHPDATPRGISLKVTLPASAEVPINGVNGTPRVKLNVSPAKDDAEQGAKRPRVNLKFKKKSETAGATAAGANGDAAVVEGQHNGGGGEAANGETSLPEKSKDAEEGVKDDPVVVQESVVRALDKDVRDALAIVLAQMAVDLPRPLNTLLTLPLPPTFDRKDENTLAHVLNQEDLSWERLVELLHVFSTHLLQPCAYPVPFPPLSHIHATIPPLPPHQPHHAIYAFCASLRDIILSIEPTTARGPNAGQGLLEKWALIMRAPAPGGTDGRRGGGDWWTGIADWREAERIKVKNGGGEGVLERFAADGGKFGYANAVSITSFAGSTTGLASAPTLGESIVQKASLKAQRWKEMLARRKGGFGSFHRPVAIPRVSHLPWTPTFGPSFDSNYAAGGVGYWTTLEAMHQRERYKSWSGPSGLQVQEGGETKGYWGSLEAKGEGATTVEHGDVGMEDVGPEAGEEGTKSGRGVDDVLRDNADWLNELVGWQEARVRKGEKEVGEREQVVAEELLNSLASLSATIPPSALIPNLEPGFAHRVSKRLIHTPAPTIRGTLDPRRPKAIHDNATIRPRPSAMPSASLPPVPSMSNGPSVAQQLAGTPTRSSNGAGSGYTPASQPAQAKAYQPRQSSSASAASQRQSYGYAGSPMPSATILPGGLTPQSIPRTGIIPTSQLLGQSTEYRHHVLPQPAPPRQTYVHTPYQPGLLGGAGGAGGTGNTIYSRGSPGVGPGQQGPQGQPVMMASPGLGPGAMGPGSPSPTGGVGVGQYARPGMQPSGLRQSFGPDAGGSQGGGGGGGYFAGMGRS